MGTNIYLKKWRYFHLLIKFTDPDIRTKKSRYPDPDLALTDPTFYYPDPDSASPDIRIFGSDPDRITDRIRISDKSFRPNMYIYQTSNKREICSKERWGKEDCVSEWNNYKWNNYIDSLGNSLLYLCPLALFMFSLMFLINSQVLSLSFVFLGSHVFKQEELYGKLLTQILEVSGELNPSN
ncbi:hypothetical protein YC2023_057923 [Brassica napus]